MNIIFGTDIGGVLVPLIQRSHGKTFEDLAFRERVPHKDAFEVLSRIVHDIGFRNVHVISKCKKPTEDLTRIWLNHHDFHYITGIPEENLHFCINREDKNPICEKLGITHFVDDRIDILLSLATVKFRYWFNPKPWIHTSGDEEIQIVHNWKEIHELYAKTKPAD